MAYSSQSITGYNTSPPADDGTQSEANKVKWSTIKTKLGDPVKNLAESINSANGAAWSDLASTATDNGTNGFHNVSYPLTAAEVTAGVTPTNYEYKEGDVRRYGAAVDGSTDDSTALIDAMKLATTLYIPEGIMTLGLTAALTCLSNQSIKGAGKYKTTLKLTGNPSSFTKVFGGDSISNWEISDLKIDLDIATNTYTITPIILNFTTGGSNIKIHDLFIPGSKSSGIWVKNTTNLAVEYNDIQNTVNDSIRTDSGNEISVVGNKITALTNLAGEKRAIIAGSSNNVTVTHNIIEDVPTGGSGATRFVFDFGGATKVTCANNICNNCGAMVDLEGGSTDITITGNVFGGKSSDTAQHWGVYCIGDGAQKVTIADNIFDGLYHAIRCEAGDYYTITGNIIRSCYGAGITITASGAVEADHVTITGNIVRDCSLSGSGSFAGMVVRALTGTVAGNLVRGTNHSYAISDNSNNLDVQFANNVMGAGATGTFEGAKNGSKVTIQGAAIHYTSANPESSVTGNEGDICIRNTGSKGIPYIKDTGTGNTGWIFMATSDAGTGGAGSAGAGNQYIEIQVGSTTYKVLHDGTV